jgi:hypothetical protein
MKIVPVKLAKWFPSDDELAKKIARLCIFREELMFQFRCAIESRDVSDKDDYSAAWREIYYFRHMFGTLQEIRRSLESLAMDANFKSFLATQSPKLQKEFTKLKKNLESEREKIKTLRGEIGVHIEEDIVGEALQNMSHERWGFLQIYQGGPTKTHFKFVGELIMSIMFRNIPDKEHIHKAQENVDTLTNSMRNIFHIIDWIFFAYAKNRRLLNIHMN